MELRAATLLAARGWSPRVAPFTGYGGPGWVRLFARVLLSRPDSPPRLRSRGWRSFLTLPVAGASVEVLVGPDSFSVSADRGGYVDVRLPSTLPPGVHEVSFSLPGTAPVLARVHVFPDSFALGVVSDVDDTVLVTHLPRPLLAFWNTFVRSSSARVPVPGMAELYGELRRAHPDLPLVYLSTGAWNVAPTLERFFSEHGLPPGPVLLTDWGPTANGWFRSGRAHKRAKLAQLASEFPSARWLLVGDDGQHDPEVYSGFARTHRGRVAAIAIRSLSPLEAALAHGAAPPAAVEPVPGVPTLLAPDGFLLADRLRSAGLL